MIRIIIEINDDTSVKNITTQMFIDDPYETKSEREISFAKYLKNYLTTGMKMLFDEIKKG